MEHPDTILAMTNLAITYRNLGRHTEAEKLETQACELKSRVLGEESHTITTTMATVQGAQEIKVLDAGSTVSGDQALNSSQVILNPA